MLPLYCVQRNSTKYKSFLGKCFENNVLVYIFILLRSIQLQQAPLIFYLLLYPDSIQQIMPKYAEDETLLEEEGHDRSLVPLCLTVAFHAQK